MLAPGRYYQNITDLSCSRTTPQLPWHLLQKHTVPRLMIASKDPLPGDTDRPSWATQSLPVGAVSPPVGVDPLPWDTHCPSGYMNSPSWGTGYSSVGMGPPSDTTDPSAGAIVWLSAIVADATSGGVLLQYYSAAAAATPMRQPCRG